MSLVCHLGAQVFEKSSGMAGDRSTETHGSALEAAQVDEPERDDVGDDVLSGVAGAIGSVYLALAGFTFRTFENFSDRRAEAGAVRKSGANRSASLRARRDSVGRGPRR
jgi:hypothetical protein